MRRKIILGILTFLIVGLVSWMATNGKALADKREKAQQTVNWTEHFAGVILVENEEELSSLFEDGSCDISKGPGDPSKADLWKKSFVFFGYAFKENNPSYARGDCLMVKQRCNVQSAGTDTYLSIQYPKEYSNAIIYELFLSDDSQTLYVSKEGKPVTKGMKESYSYSYTTPEGTIYPDEMTHRYALDVCIDTGRFAENNNDVRTKSSSTNFYGILGKNEKVAGITYTETKYADGQEWNDSDADYTVFFDPVTFKIKGNDLNYESQERPLPYGNEYFLYLKYKHKENAVFYLILESGDRLIIMDIGNQGEDQLYVESGVYVGDIKHVATLELTAQN